MSNIHSVRLENFQSHMDTIIDFTNGLNVIVGQSDSGKTAIFRGIRWALYNQPRGTDFIRVGADFVRVSVSFDHGITIVRERTSSKNRYTVKKEGEPDLVLEGFGVHVPIEVTEAHGMNHLRVDQDTELMIHLSQQLDGPFLLEQSSSTRAKTLGRISGAHFLDMAIRDATKDLSQLNQRLKIEEKAIETLQEKVDVYKPLEGMKMKLEHSEKDLNKLKKLFDTRKKLDMIRKKINRIAEEITVTNKQNQLVQHVDEWSMNVENIEVDLREYVTYNHQRKRYKDISQAMDICREWLNKTIHVNDALALHVQTVEQLTYKTKLKTLSHTQFRVRQELAKTHNQLNKTQFVNDIHVGQIDGIISKRTIHHRLRTNQERMKRITKQQIEANEFISKLPQISATNKRRDDIKETYIKLEKLQFIHSRLREIDRRTIEGVKFVQAKTNEQDKAQLLWEEHLHAEGTCPTCGQSIHNHKGG